MACLPLAATALPIAAQELPDGSGKETLAKVCSQYHGLDIIINLKHTKAEWKTLVNSRAGNGASTKPREPQLLLSCAIISPIDVEGRIHETAFQKLDPGWSSIATRFVDPVRSAKRPKPLR